MDDPVLHATRSRARFVGLVLMTLALLAPSFLDAPPASAGPDDSMAFTSEAFVIEREGDEYEVRVRAEIFDVDFGGGHFVTYRIVMITVSRRDDPDGAGPISVHRKVSWDRSARWSLDSDLGDGKLNPSDYAGPRLTADMDWTPSAPARSRCKGDGISRAGVFKGPFTFRTGDDVLGDIHVEKLRGTAYRSGDGCVPSGPAGSTACPRAGFDLTDDIPDGYVEGRRSGGRATLEASTREYLSRGWARSQTVVGRVPVTDVTLGRDAGVGMLRGAVGSYFSGQSEYSSTDDPPALSWEPCGEDKEYATASTEGTFTNGLTVDFLVGPDRVVSGEGTADRTSVRSVA